MHYSPPFRLYLFASVFFFLTVFWTLDAANTFKGFEPGDLTISEDDLAELEKEDPESAEQIRALIETQTEESVQPSDDATASAAGDDGEAPDTAEPKETSFDFINSTWDDVSYSGPDWLEIHLQRMFEAAQRSVEDPRLFITQAREYLPRFLLLAPVLYALVLLILYFYRRKFYVYDHFVISLYIHAAFYTYMLTAILLSKIPVVGGVMAGLTVAWSFAQPFAVFKQAYGSGTISAVLKGLISTTIYTAGVGIIVLVGIAYSLYQS